MGEETPTTYDIFLCYHTGGGTHFAKHLWEKLPDNGYRAFLDIEDIPKIIKKESDDYRNLIDKAILNCKYFILIMTRGFKDRKEIKREYKLAKDNNIKRLHYKYHSLDHSDCIMDLFGEVHDLYDKEWTKFSNESNLYLEVTDALSGKKLINVSKDAGLKRELFISFFEPIYSNIQIILENYQNQGYDYNHNSKTYDKVGAPNRFKLRRYKNTELKNEIDLFYKKSVQRQTKLNYYDRSANSIISKVTLNAIKVARLDSY